MTMKSDILARIADYKREELAAAQARRPLELLKEDARDASPPRGFRALTRCEMPW